MAIVSGIFKTYEDASQAIIALENSGIMEDQVSLIMTDEARGQHFNLRKDNKADEGVAAGASLGGMVGAIAGLVAGAGVIAIPGLNVIVAGTLVAALAGLGAGAATGGIIGGLIGAGIPEVEAKMYEKEIRGGKVLLAVETKNDLQKQAVKDIFDSLNADRKAA